MTSTFEPDIKTSLPGPNTQALMSRDAQYISTSYTRGYPLSIASGDGPMVTDVDGNRFLDFCSGIAVCASGHSHQSVVQAIKDQADKFLHMSGTDFYYSNMVDLAERLAKSAPGSSQKRVFFTNSGAESNECAIKLARYHTKRQYVITFYRSFHGRTYGALSIGASKAIQRKHFGPLLPGVLYAHYPYFYRDMFNSPNEEACAENCLDYINDYLFKMIVPPDEVAAIIVEPIQGEGGYVPAPASFLLGLQSMARQHGIMVIADEVQSGMGRTGKMWASQLTPGFEPDIICSAKGIASGLPLGAVIARDDVMQWEPGTHASTFGGNPVACAAALKTIDLLEGDNGQPGLLANTETIGSYMKQKLIEMAKRHDCMGDVRGHGLMLGIEIVNDKASKTKAPALRDKIVDDCFYQGLIILGCGENSIRFCPPLVITQDHADEALRIFESVLVH